MIFRPKKEAVEEEECYRCPFDHGIPLLVGFRLFDRNHHADLAESQRSDNRVQFPYLQPIRAAIYLPGATERKLC